MRFWDASAVVPLVVEEAASPACRALLASDTAMAVWRLSAVEVMSAVRRLEREGRLDRTGVSVAVARLGALRDGWVEVTALDVVAERAIRVLAVHRLPAADALQLAAAIELVSDRPDGFDFVTRDVRLADEASRAGFRVHEP